MSRREDIGGMVWTPVVYEPMPWQTHPIDIVHGPQGWGPFDGPYTPRDYVTPTQSVGGMSGVSDGYNRMPLTVDHGPGYHDITVFPDRSLDSVNNMLVQAQNEQSPQGVAYSSTIANALARVKEQGPRQAQAGALLSRLRSTLTQAP